MFGREPFSSQLRLSNLKAYKYDWTWVKPKGTGFLNAKKQPLRNTENISVFYTRQCLYNPQLTAGEPYGNKSGKTKMAPKSVYGKFMDGAEYRTVNTGFRLPKTTLEFGVIERGTVHPTQKPTDLLEYLIRTYTNEGMAVLDCCMGSGSTCVACVNTGRHYIGFEKEQKYFDIAAERIAAAKEAKSASSIV